MEALVNYSDDEQEDREEAERGYREPQPSHRSNHGRGEDERRNVHRNETSDDKYKPNRPSSSYTRDGGNKDRFIKEDRDSRDSSHNNRHDRPTHDRHSQRHNRDRRNDEYNKRDERSRGDERSRADERSRGDERTRGEDRYTSRNSSTTPNFNKRARYSDSRNSSSYESSSSRHQRSYRGNDDRSERYSSSRYERYRQHGRNSGRNRSTSRSRSKERRSSPSQQDSSPMRDEAILKRTHQKELNSEKTARNIDPLMSLPLSSGSPKHPNVSVACSSSVSLGNSYSGEQPSIIQLPSYYNPSVINPSKYAEQVQKRKLLWGAKKSENTAAKWGSAQFSQDTDGKVASKFMRLMGIKNASSSKNEAEVKPTTSPTSAPDVKSREEMFSSMEHQYEIARQVTHTMRGVGLGFGSSRPF